MAQGGLAKQMALSGLNRKADQGSRQ